MNCDLFKLQLSEAAPPLQALRSMGYSDQEAAAIFSTFQIKERSTQVDLSPPEDEALRDLFVKYDPSNLEIGMVRFAPVPTTVANGWRIGTVEVDDLISTRAGEVVVEELHSRDHILWRCASSGGCLLAALLAAARFLGSRLASNDDEPMLRAKVHQDCVFLAGGERYSDFYRMLLGLE